MTDKLIFIFLDGFGMGERASNNPFIYAEMPFLNKLLEGPIINDNQVLKPGVLLKGIDANLGVEGLPQSATGQTALFTGDNASKVLGYHLPAFPNEKLREIINKSNIMKNAVEAGKKAVFANSYSQGYFDMVSRGKRAHSVTTLCTLSAGIRFRNIEDLNDGRAVYWDITNQYLKEKQNAPVDIINPVYAGKNLAKISQDYNLVIYESFLTDLVGHKNDFSRAVEILEILDMFISGVLTYIGNDVTVVITSDHGNIEEIGDTGHTRNPVPLFVYGNNADKFDSAESITDISEIILSVI